MPSVDSAVDLMGRIEKKVKRTPRGNHWRWQGAESGSGHPMIAAKPLGKALMPVRHVLWKMTNGRVPPKHYIFATCGCPWCVNPTHQSITSDKGIAQLYKFYDKKMAKVYRFVVK